jgi:hypothetical protein
MNRSSGRFWLRDLRGQAVAEFAMVLPILLIVFLGIIEMSNALGVAQSLSRVSREGANIAARGTGMDTVLQVVFRGGGDIRLRQRGGGIVTRVEVGDEGAVVVDQVATSGFQELSRIGATGEPAVLLNDLDLEEGTTHYVVELFYRYDPITPLPRFVERTFPRMLYERAVF